MPVPPRPIIGVLKKSNVNLNPWAGNKLSVINIEMMRSVKVKAYFAVMSTLKEVGVTIWVEISIPYFPVNIDSVVNSTLHIVYRIFDEDTLKDIGEMPKTWVKV